ncbi:MAG: hypothetical protein IJM08_00810 [Firmicutes bacterium]|nr:hypothetical protein [Bacillota bacterium]
MKITSAEAGKLLKSMQSDINSIIYLETQKREFAAASTEDPESNRPAYDYEAVQKELAEKEKAIRILKHAINKFNTETKVPGFDMTIDQMLIYIPQLTARKSKLDAMRSRLPKERRNSFTSNIIDYSYANYDIAKAEEDYQKVSEELTRAQLALDSVNSTKKITVEL